MSITARDIMRDLVNAGFRVVWGNTGGGVYNIIVMDGDREAVFISDNGEWTENDEDEPTDGDYGVTVYNHDGFVVSDCQRTVDIVAAVKRGVGPVCAPPTRDEGGYFGKTMNAGQLIDWLSKFPTDMPITVGTNIDGVSEWLNISGASDPHATGEYSVILYTEDDFDTRQW